MQTLNLLFSIEFAANTTSTARAKLELMWRRWSLTTSLLSKRYVIYSYLLYCYRFYVLVSYPWLQILLQYFPSKLKWWIDVSIMILLILSTLYLYQLILFSFIEKPLVNKAWLLYTMGSTSLLSTLF